MHDHGSEAHMHCHQEQAAVGQDLHRVSTLHSDRKVLVLQLKYHDREEHHSSQTAPGRCDRPEHSVQLIQQLPFTLELSWLPLVLQPLQLSLLRSCASWELPFPACACRSGAAAQGWGTHHHQEQVAVAVLVQAGA